MDNIFEKLLRFLVLSLAITTLILPYSTCKEVDKTASSIKRASAMASTTTSFHLTICSSIDEGNQQCVEGEFQSPDRMSISVEKDGQINEFLIIIGDRLYQKDTQTNDWQLSIGRSAQVSQTSIQRLLSDVQLKTIADNYKELENIENLSNEVIDGVTCFHYRGTIDPLKELRKELDIETDPFIGDSIQKIIETQEQMQVNTGMEFWISKSDNIVRRKIITQSWTEDKTTTMLTTTINFSNINQTVDIKPPYIQFTKVTAPLTLNGEEPGTDIPWGSVVYHWANDITEVYGPDDNLIFIAKDNEATIIPHPSAPGSSGLSPATHIIQVPSGAHVTRGETDNVKEIYFNGNLILTVIEKSEDFILP